MERRFLRLIAGRAVALRWPSWQSVIRQTRFRTVTTHSRLLRSLWEFLNPQHRLLYSASSADAHGGDHIRADVAVGRYIDPQQSIL